MGYEVEITRDPGYSRMGKGPRIHLEEWLDVVYGDPELTFEAMPPGARIPSLDVRWIAHPNAAVPDTQVHLWFSRVNGITTTYPDEHLLRKMVVLADQLKAVVVGDNGERYRLGEDGELVADETGPHGAPAPMIYGFGAGACGNLTAAIEKSGVAAIVQPYSWYLGFLTSFNQARHAGGHVPVNYRLDDDSLAADHKFLRDYAVRHPDHPFIRAALALIHERDRQLNPFAADAGTAPSGR